MRASIYLSPAPSPPLWRIGGAILSCLCRVFGVVSFWLVFKGAETVSTYFKFLDSFAGRGLYFLLVGSQIPSTETGALPSTVCAATLVFGALNIGTQSVLPLKNDLRPTCAHSMPQMR